MEKNMAKVPLTLIDEEKVKKSKLILVTAITPTKAKHRQDHSLGRSGAWIEQNREKSSCGAA